MPHLDTGTLECIAGIAGIAVNAGLELWGAKKKKEDSRTFDREHCTATPACPDDDDRDDMYVLICECS